MYGFHHDSRHFGGLVVVAVLSAAEARMSYVTCAKSESVRLGRFK